MEDGAPRPMTITEFEEWQAFFRLRAERMDQQREELEEKLKTNAAARGAKGAGGVDTDPPVMGSGKKKRKKPQP